MQNVDGTMVSVPTPVQPSTAGDEVVRTSTPAEVRAWAKTQGLDVGTRGRISQEVKDLYTEATGNQVTSTTVSQG